VKKSVIKSLTTAAAIALSSFGAYAVEIDETAPAFKAPSTQGIVRLGDYEGEKNIVLAFYFADFTPV